MSKNISLKTSFSFILVFFFFTASLTQAKEITLKYKGLHINAALELAEGKTLKDGVILITHGSLAHRDMQTIAYLRTLLNEYEYNTLSINLSLGVDNRHGMYDCKTLHQHLYDDAVDEIGTWVAWLKSQGVTNVTLLGHSKGGAQTALYALENDNDLIKSIILIAPATKDKGRSKKLNIQIQKAQLVKGINQSKQVIQNVPIMHCKNATASVKSFLSYNLFSPKQDTPTLLAKIKKPVLVLIGGMDTTVVGLEKKLAPLTEHKNIHMKIIETAGHFFRDLNMDEAVEAMDAFLQKVHKL